MWEPMNPAPPVTKARIFFPFPKFPREALGGVSSQNEYTPAQKESNLAQKKENTACFLEIRVGNLG
jgi:hypothetical protein